MLEHAIILRRELPTRSVNDIIRILEFEEVIQPGTVHRSTLQRHLQSAGFGAKQVRIYTQKGAAAKRVQKPHRMMLLQGDIKYGPYLPIGKDGKRKQVYLSAFVDNGQQYRSEWLKKACNRLGIKLSFAKPYSPASKGKIEFFNKRIDAFLAEVALDQPKTLEELNKALELWINEYYHKNPHTGLDGLSPGVAFRSDKRALKFASADEITAAFLHTETRQVDKTGCISLNGEKYEVGIQLMGRKVEVYFDPSWADAVEIHHKDFKPFQANRLIIGENCGVTTSLPEAMTPLTANGSRLLSALEGSDEKVKPSPAISFKDIGGDCHV